MGMKIATAPVELMKADKSGELELSWTDDDGKTISAKKKINVG